MAPRYFYTLLFFAMGPILNFDYSGQHVYLHVPLLSAGGHPFTVSSIDKPVEHTGDSTPPRISTVILLIRVRNGLTRRLYNLTVGDSESDTSSQEGKETRLISTGIVAPLSPVWLEGPYGHLTHLDYYQTVLLCAGGSGATFCLPIILDIVRRARAMQLGVVKQGVATERLTFVWTVRGEFLFVSIYQYRF